MMNTYEHVVVSIYQYLLGTKTVPPYLLCYLVIKQGTYTVITYYERCKPKISVSRRNMGRLFLHNAGSSKDVRRYNGVFLRRTQHVALAYRSLLQRLEDVRHSTLECNRVLTKIWYLQKGKKIPTDGCEELGQVCSSFIPPFFQSCPTPNLRANRPWVENINHKILD